ncbi:hypothetical protein [Palleronia pelagia]|uniref:Uncharacterized protein n=1 Tax=Palleronia pelagia TaxID=387096 RepID=A0A1H8HYB2_9RHOB|nr:hypothetical protein [Palleronia pelagia]SEN61072.1 hypothetical protein SAMN04488011_10542 [Palleronia pelagia]
MTRRLDERDVAAAMLDGELDPYRVLQLFAGSAPDATLNDLTRRASRDCQLSLVPDNQFLRLCRALQNGVTSGQAARHWDNNPAFRAS